MACTSSVHTFNSRTPVRIGNEVRPAAEWCQRHGIRWNTAYHRVIRHGFSEADAVTEGALGVKCPHCEVMKCRDEFLKYRDGVTHDRCQLCEELAEKRQQESYQDEGPEPYRGPDPAYAARYREIWRARKVPDWVAGYLA